jgi:hypothetical protein
LLALFTEAFRGTASTLCFHGTSIAERSNRMRKNRIQSQIDSPAEKREGYVRTHAVKALGLAYRLERQSRRQHFLREILDVPVSRSVCNLVHVRVKESREWHVTRSAENPEVFEATNSENVRWTIVTESERPICECNETSGTGLPCADLIALYAQFVDGAFHVPLVARRWIPNLELELIAQRTIRTETRTRTMDLSIGRATRHNASDISICFTYGIRSLKNLTLP